MRKLLLLPIFFLTQLDANSIKSNLQEMLSTNPSVQERLQNYKAIREDVESAKSGYYPKLDINAGAGYDKEHRTTNSYEQDSSLSIYQASIKYTQNIFNGLSTTYLVKEQKYKTLAAAYSYIQKVNDVSYDYISAYLDVIKNKKLLKTAKENVDINTEVLNKVKKLYKSGFTTLSEVNKIESSLALAKSNMIVQENTLDNKKYNLEKILGRKIDIANLKDFNMPIKIPNTKDEVVQKALNNNPSLQISKFNKQSAKALKKEKEANYYPKIDIEISQSINNNSSETEPDINSFKAMAYLSYNIFNGLKDRHGIVKSQSQIEQENQNILNIKRELLQKIDAAWNSRKKSKEQLVFLRKYNDFSIKTLKLYQKEYALGQRSLLDLLASQNDLIKSKEQIINTNYNILSANYKLLNAMNMLVSSILKSDSIYTDVNIKSKGI